jgi:hypothetical protein
VKLSNSRTFGARARFYTCPTREQAVRDALIALIVTLGTLMTAAWLFVLGVLAVGLIDGIF